MRRLRFSLVNVFARQGDRFSGNPLCVFEDGTGLTDEQMQALGRQTNLSETTFILPSAQPHATARVRIFTPSLEMPFAGHPTLGTAHVVNAMRSCKGRVSLEMKAGLVGVSGESNTWTLETAYAPKTRAVDAPPEELAAMIGVGRIGGAALWVDTGVEQLIVPLASPEEVRDARPSVELLSTHAAQTSGDKSSVYVWARSQEDGKAVARYFFVQGGGIIEDPATGSACANLGGWMIATHAPQPLTLEVQQGEAVGRPSVLRLRVDEGKVFVSGLVDDAGHGEMYVDG